MSHCFWSSCFQQNVTSCSVLVCSLLFRSIFIGFKSLNVWESLKVVKMLSGTNLISTTMFSLNAHLSCLFVLPFRLRSVGGWRWKSCPLCWCSISRGLFLKRLEAARNWPRTSIIPLTWKLAKVYSTPGAQLGPHSLGSHEPQCFDIEGWLPALTRNI